MCRLYGFRSSIVSRVHQSLVEAENALGRQSEKHRDGWGVSYYVSNVPHLIRNDQQALADTLFREITAVVATRTFLAHIRQATVGDVGVLNCHPFQHGRWTFVHNGQIGRYAADPTLHERVAALVDPRFARYILGDTDSEVIFHIFLSRLARLVEDIHNVGVNADHAITALRHTVLDLLALDGHQDEDNPTKLTVLLTNGHLMLGYRRGVELYYSTYKHRCPDRETCHAYEPARCEHEVRDGIVKHLVLASEVIGTTNVWQLLDDNEWVAVGHGMNLRRGPLTST